MGAACALYLKGSVANPVSMRDDMFYVVPATSEAVALLGPSGMGAARASLTESLLDNQFGPGELPRPG